MGQQPQKVSPETLAAFYRQRSESLRNSHTTSGAAPVPPPVATPVQQVQRTWFQSIMHALGAEGW
jgi:hypothetical protein